ncbi:MAG: trimeric intracellular cation channel family protein [Candidatus Gastranaerophilaceae bacterium]
MKFGNEIIIIELIGIIAFAISGAIVAIKRNFDIFGIIVLGVITAVGGGALRDIILGVIPPTMFKNSLYVFVAFVTSCISFVAAAVATVKFKKNQQFFIDVVNFFDAIGLGIFAVTGTNTAIINGFGNNAFLSVFVGVITGIGGGMLRDILAGKAPFVLYKDIYASAAIAGASLYYLMFLNGVNAAISVTSTIIITILIRLAASFYHLSLPRIPKINIKDDKDE